ncbi:MAG: hypothetical protein ACK58L_04085 [Planctomycetota bacterium]
MNQADYEELIEKARGLEANPTKLSLLEQAVRIADSLGDRELGFEARNDLIRTATFCGMAEKSLPAFSWCLAQIDANPEKFETDEMLWEYKWILSAVRKFPMVTLKQIVELENDFERRLTNAGYSLRPFYDARLSRLQYPEDAKEKEEYFQRWRTSVRDHLADCKACEEASVASYYLETNQPESGLRESFRILGSRTGCHAVPHTTMAEMLLPLHRAGRTEEARSLQLRGYRMISRNRDFLGYIGNHMEYLIHAGETALALKMLVRHLPWALETREFSNKLKFLHVASLVLDKVGDRRRKLKLPKDFPLYESSDTYVPTQLSVWFRAESERVADLFDQRNGNRHQRNWMERTRAEVAECS